MVLEQQQSQTVGQLDTLGLLEREATDSRSGTGPACFTSRSSIFDPRSLVWSGLGHRPNHYALLRIKILPCRRLHFLRGNRLEAGQVALEEIEVIHRYAARDAVGQGVNALPAEDGTGEKSRLDALQLHFADRLLAERFQLGQD